jgi:hypothetical protein
MYTVRNNNTPVWTVFSRDKVGHLTLPLHLLALDPSLQQQNDSDN